MKNLLLILMATFALLFIMGQLGQAPKREQAAGVSAEAGLVNNTVRETRSLINNARQAGASQQLLSADSDNKTFAMPNEEQDEVAGHEKSLEESVWKSTPQIADIPTADHSSQSMHTANDVTAPALADVLSDEGVTFETQDTLLQHDQPAPVVHHDRHTIEEVIELSRDNANRFRRIHSLINRD